MAARHPQSIYRSGWAIRQEDAAARTVALNPPKDTDEPPKDIGETPPTNLPASAVNLIRRTESVQQLQDLLSAYRTVTLTGPGGIGKTTLALEVGPVTLPRLRDGGWLVELAALSNANLVPAAVVAVLDLRLSSEAISAETVARAIGDRNLLLVLDNCEDVIDAAAGLAETILSRPRTCWRNCAPTISNWRIDCAVRTGCARNMATSRAPACLRRGSTRRQVGFLFETSRNGDHV